MQIAEPVTSEPQTRTPSMKSIWVDLILLVILAGGAYFRLTGLLWGDYQYLHPDERFLIWVGRDITPIKDVVQAADGSQRNVWLSWSDYFNTNTSPLNPQNRGHDFYVYGTLPMFLTRVLVQIFFGHSGFNEMTVIGRVLSAFADLLTVYLVFLIAKRLYNHRVGLLAAALMACAVLPIQLAHYFTFDTFTNVFLYAAVYFAVLIALGPTPAAAAPSAIIYPALDDFAVQVSDLTARKAWNAVARFFKQKYVLNSILFGLFIGMAMASKINAAVLALILPLALFIWWMKIIPEERTRHILPALLSLALGGAVCLLVFRVTQPYAFAGPGFFGLALNPKWIDSLRQLSIQSTGAVDFPPALQWIRRSRLFSLDNMVLWGLGLPLGSLVWAGFFYMAWKMLRGEWLQHLLLWGWTGPYFLWQSLVWNSSMRYQMPVYPVLIIMGAWLVVKLWEVAQKSSDHSSEKEPANTGPLFRILSVLLGAGVLAGTVVWAFAFTRIYNRPITRVAASEWIYQNIPGPINLHYQTGQTGHVQLLPFPNGYVISAASPYYTDFAPQRDGRLDTIRLYRIVDNLSQPGEKTLRLDVIKPSDGRLLATGTLSGNFVNQPLPDPSGYTVRLSQPVEVKDGDVLGLVISLEKGSGSLTISGSTLVNESSWDDRLPLRVDNYTSTAGIYPGELNFEMYWDDNPEKLQRFVNNLDQGDVILITSNRQWATTTRVPERYPLTSAYYRNLLGCPDGETIIDCYSVAIPGMFHGRLGFDLAAVFQSDPSIGPLDINDQFAEEAFTVYDHPKVFIFRKSPDYDPNRMRVILSGVDLSHVVHATPKQANQAPQPVRDLMLPAARLAVQQAGGTWSELFNVQALQNKYPFLGAVLWYVCIALLGLISYPLARLVFPGLPDRGYPLARTLGLLLLAYLTWLAGSYQIPFTRLTISLVLLLLLAVGVALAYFQREDLRLEWREKRTYFLVVEALALGLFILFLLVRLGNPDLWHTYKGGEKPMDFSYFNAVLKSTTFPPYDPWFAGGYINYYYYGYVIVGVLVKWLGIVPSIAYNLILPALYCVLGLGAFSVGWNLVFGAQALAERRPTPEPESPDELNTDPPPDQEKPARPAALPWLPLVTGLAATAALQLLGNLGTVRMIWYGLQRLSAPGGNIDKLTILQRWSYSALGFVRFLAGTRLPYGPGDWYWIPSRAIPGEPITEFPAFTFLYADLHAHLIALPITVLVIAWALGVLLAKGRWGDGRGRLAAFSLCASLALGGMAIGALRPTNTWDFYTYLALGAIALLYTQIRHGPPGLAGRFMDRQAAQVVNGAGLTLLLIVLAFVTFKPFTDWFVQGYNQINIWEGDRTPFWSYVTHWGLFLFVIISWMVWETRDWMAKTPLSRLNDLRKHQALIYEFLAVVVCLMIVLTFFNYFGDLFHKRIDEGVGIAWFVLPLAAWAAVLILRPGQPDSKRLVLFMIGTGLILTLMVEVIVLVGDIGRMNTVFKFYYQAWTLLALSAAAAAGWLFVDVNEWLPGWRYGWQVALSVLVFGAFLFPIMAGMDKIDDRMAPNAPHTLDGTAFMNYATYTEDWGTMDLSQDYDAIHWMQEHVIGSPVIVEANQRNLYRWSTRYTIYTGLPGVVGWEWHQQQQRVSQAQVVSARIQEIEEFYRTTNFGEAVQFLEKYNVKYIVLGQIEEGLYMGPGLGKFPMLEGKLWKTVYHAGVTTIYEVIPQTRSSQLDPGETGPARRDPK